MAHIASFKQLDYVFSMYFGLFRFVSFDKDTNLLLYIPLDADHVGHGSKGIHYAIVAKEDVTSFVLFPYDVWKRLNLAFAKEIGEAEGAPTQVTPQVVPSV